MASEKGELVRAADIFESIGMESMQSNLGKLVFTPENSKQSRQKWVSEFENVRQASSLRRVTSCSACCAIWRRETPCRRRPRCPAARTRTTPSGLPESAASWRSCWRLGHPTSPTTALLLNRIVFTFCFSFCGTYYVSFLIYLLGCVGLGFSFLMLMIVLGYVDRAWKRPMQRTSRKLVLISIGLLRWTR